MEKPILFKDPMIQAILDGRKTQTRRVLKNQPKDIQLAQLIQRFEPQYRVKDILWVRETWRPESEIGEPAAIYYRADGYKWLCPEFKDALFLKPNDRDDLWRPSIYMPRWASRLSLLVTGIKVGRLQDITDEDAIAEGIDRTNTSIPGYAIQRFQKLWDSINKKRGYGWDTNPWVWKVEFE